MSISRSYEPTRFDELVFASSVSRNICEAYVLGHSHLARDPLLLYGPPGSGKTAAARVIAQERCALGQGARLDEFNGSDLTPSDFSSLGSTAAFHRVFFGNPVLIINELDELGEQGQHAFRSWRDKHPHIELIATTNEPAGTPAICRKLRPAVISRFQCVELAAPSLADIKPRMTAIFGAEGVPITDADLDELLGTFRGDLRDALRVVDRVISQLKSQGVAAPHSTTLRVVS